MNDDWERAAASFRLAVAAEMHCNGDLISMFDQFEQHQKDIDIILWSDNPSVEELLDVQRVNRKWALYFAEHYPNRRMRPRWAELASDISSDLRQIAIRAAFVRGGLKN